jgi:hypothetical protein
MKTSTGERALTTAFNKELERDSLFLEKCQYHNSLLLKYNKTNQSPMELDQTEEGREQLAIINAKVSQEMIKKYGV